MKQIFYFLFCMIILSCSKQENLQINSMHWELQNSGNKSSIRGIDALDENNVWLSGSLGKYAITNDGGKTWVTDSVPGADSLDFRDIEVISKDVVYLMSAGLGEKSNIYKTKDGGKSWTLQKQNEHAEGFYDGFAFWDENTAILIGDPVGGSHFLLKTTDGGKNWNRIEPEKLAPLADGEIGGFAASGTTIEVNGDNVWFATGGKVARVHHSTDRGETWQVYNTPILQGGNSTGIFSIDFRDDYRGVVVGGDYTKAENRGLTTAYTKDGGRNWTLPADTSIVTFSSCVQYIQNSNVLVAVSRSAKSFYSTDDGRSWSAFGGHALYTLSFAKNGKSAWAAGPNGKVAKLIIE